MGYENRFIRRRGFLLAVLTAVMFLRMTTSAGAQPPTGTILGIVKDTTGAVVAGASVIVRNVGTGTTRTITTGEEGAFRVPALSVGRYDITVELAGFKAGVRRGVELEVAQEAVVNFTLEVGDTSQEVEVIAEAAQVNTTSSTVGGMVSETRISALPLNGRNFVDLTLLQTGVTQQINPGGGSVGSGGPVYSSNGAPIRSNAYLLDGASMVNGYGASIGSIAGTTLGVDGIKEFKVVTNTFGAEYGMTMGSQMTIVSKSGTNDWHGSLFEYLRNDALDARNYFDAPTSVLGRRLPRFQRNNFGGSFGGPIRKDKTFFFAVYEGLREHLGTTNRDVTLGTGCRGAVGAIITNATCPQLGATPSVTIGDISPAVAQFVNLYPLPNLPGNVYASTFSQPTTVNYGQMRVDHNFSTKDSFFARYTIDDGEQTKPTELLLYTNPYRSRNQFLSLSDTHIFSPVLLTTARLSASRTYIRTDAVPTYPNAPVFVPGEPGGGTITVTGLSRFRPDCCSPTRVPQQVFTFSDDVFYQRGKHSFKFGTLMNYFQQRYELHSGRGSIAFNGVANFLRGLPQSFTGQVLGGSRNQFFTYNSYGFYVSDDLRATSRVTVNLGLRYEFITTLTGENGHSSAIRNIATDTSFTLGPPFQNPSLKNFSPRFGFAWDVFGDGKTAFRSGFGLLYDTAGFGGALGTATSSLPPFAKSSTTTIPAGTTFPSGVPAFTIPLVIDSANAAITSTSLDWNMKQPKLIQYNVAVERQLPFATLVSVAYTNSRGRNLFRNIQGNPIAAPVHGFVANGVGCDGAAAPDYIPDGSPCYAPLSRTCGNVVPACRVNPNFASLQILGASSKSWYDSLQVSVNKYVSKGLQFQSSYTFSKTLDTIQTQGVSDGSENAVLGGVPILDAALPNYSVKGPASTDARHNWRFNVLYRLPNLQTTNIAAKVFNGWWLGSIVSMQSGYPFTPNLGNNRSTYGGGGGGQDRPEFVRRPATLTIGNQTYNFVPYDPKKVITGNPQQWFNPLMFMDTRMGYVSTVGRGILRGPDLKVWDFSLNKDTRLAVLGEQGTLQFRAEVFNLLNRANFAFPNVDTFQGTGAAAGGPVEAPLGNAGLITQTVTPARQIQFALRIMF